MKLKATAVAVICFVVGYVSAKCVTDQVTVSEVSESDGPDHFDAESDASSEDAYDDQLLPVDSGVEVADAGPSAETSEESDSPTLRCPPTPVCEDL